jgi:hypothetical protein
MTISDTSPHPLLAAVAAMHAALDDLAAAGADPLYLPTPQKGTLLRELTALAARVSAVRADVLAVADDLADQTADRSPGTWLAAETRTDRREAIHDERLGAALRRRWPRVGEAVRAGRITWQQAGVVSQALDTLLDTADEDLLAKAEAHLLAEAGQFGPQELRRLGRKVLEVVAPDLADDHEHRLLLAEERRARAATRLTFRPRGDGTSDLYARLPDLVAHRLKTYLDAYTSPRRIALDTAVDQLPLPRRRGEAFCALLEHIPAKDLPKHGGTATQVVVMIDYDTLCGDLADSGAHGVAETSTGDTITAGEARRLACTGGILPVVMGGKSEILDLGRSSRLFKGPVRTAMDLRDRECRTDGCDIPAAWCEGHHDKKPWSRNGHTNLADGILLCPYHHHRAHDPTYDQTRMPNGDIRFHRRT